MTDRTSASYLEPTQEAGRDFVMRNISGPVVMLNLMRFRAVADYCGSPELAPVAPISGAEAYRRYIEHTRPFLHRSGGDIIFFGSGGHYLIGPSDERWDAAMLVRQSSAASFLAFAADPACMAGIGHRLAALEDSRLLPLIEGSPAAVLSAG